MIIYQAKNKSGFRVKPESTEFTSIVLNSGAKIETEGSRGGYTIFGGFAAMSLKISPPVPEHYDEYTDYSVDIFCRNYNGCRADISYDNEYRVHLHFSRYGSDLVDEEMIRFYVKTMTYERALNICKVISAGKFGDDATKNLVTEDLRLLNRLGIKL